MESSKLAKKIKENVSKVIKGKPEKIEMITAVFLAEGHVLLEDLPGTGKTMLSRAFAKTLNLDFKRIQFTPDLMPSDLTGLNIYNRNKNDFELKKGPVFTDILLGDEINRATPRTQSALLEALAENQVSIDGTTHELSDDFFIISTQNPIEYEGTFPLPEAQMDRFMIRMSIGYPESSEEINMLDSQQKIHPINTISAVSNDEEIKKSKEEIKSITVSDEVKNYIVRLISQTRDHKDIKVGASPRGSLSLMKLSRSYAAVKDRDFVIPDDIKEIAEYVLSHRIILNPEAKIKGVQQKDVIRRLIDEVKVVV
ncbi:MAG: AAA family ATPase [Thermotogota bacterium]